MDRFIDLLLHISHGELKDCGDYFQIDHIDQSVSLLWKNQSSNTKIDGCDGDLEDVYLAYDGCDLFSSGFKIASQAIIKKIGDVEIIPTLLELKDIQIAEKVVFPSDTIPFMLEMGNWLYGYSKQRKTYYKWDIEYHELGQEYHSLEEIFLDWKEAINE